MSKNRGLGRGLAALIPKTGSGVDEVDVDLIVPNPEQPRTVMNEDALQELAESIREHGVLQPLLVSAVDANGVYQLVAGERRLRAARMAGLERVPVVIKEAASKELLELALVENLQRQDLNALEEAQAYRRLADDFAMTQEAIAARVGKSRAAVANSMRLLALSGTIKERLAAGEVTEGHARALLAIEDEAMREAALAVVLEGHLTVRQTEELARTGLPSRATSAPAPRRADAEVSSLEARLRESLGTKVELRRNARGRGRLIVHYYSDEELEGLLQRFGVAVQPTVGGPGE